jgi:outer membrane immunogenic protein
MSTALSAIASRLSTKEEKMLRIVVALLGAIAMTGAAIAADMPVKAPPAPYVPAPVWNWTGFYIGVNLGGTWANNDSDNFTGDMSGVVGGGQIGYNWQINNVLLGVEGDFNGTGLKNSESAFVPGVGTFTADAKLPWFATARGRLGWVQGPWLVYVTGGAAWVNFEATLTGPGGGSVSDNATRSGWTAGGGVEWMFLPKWSAKLEYLFVDTDATNVTLLGATFETRAQQNIVRAGLNYHF